MDILELRHLRLVREIAQTGNMTKAARRLYISQPALSQQLKDIEDRLNTSLFVRTKKRMLITSTGKRLLDTAKVVLEEVKRAESDIIKAVSGDMGCLKIGMHCILSYKWLPGVISLYQDRYPNVDIEVGQSNSVVRDLRSDAFDIVITAMPFPSSSIGFRDLFEDEIVAIVSPDSVLGRKKFVEHNDFKDQNYISMVEKKDDAFYQCYLAPSGVNLNKFLTFRQPEAVIEMVKSNLGIGILPRWSVKAYVKSGELNACSLGKKGMTLQWTAAFLKKDRLPVYQDDFIGLIIDQAVILTAWP